MMPIFTKEQAAILDKYFPEGHCDICFMNYIDVDMQCSNCECEDEYTCDFHNQFCGCYDCYHESNHDSGKIVCYVLKHIMINNGIAEFKYVYATIADLVDQTCINLILIECVKMTALNEARYLIDILHADINYKPHQNILLLRDIEMGTEVLQFLQANDYNFRCRDRYGYNALDWFTYSYLNDIFTTNLKKYKCITRLLQYVGFEQLSIRIISGMEYGDKTYSGINNHQWRRRRINELIQLGMTYSLDECIYKNHPDCNKHQLLRNTRLGYYLSYLECLKQIRIQVAQRQLHFAGRCKTMVNYLANIYRLK